ncbi:MAG: TAXI family TRAP transporter solute-binding subunit [Sphaerochaetaceae bacterium]|nr:TAXI family TRAP transporter solute-binding subunit [Sphaerochaetaceae bacterium]
MKKVVAILVCLSILCSVFAGGSTEGTTSSSNGGMWLGADLSGVAGAVGGGWYSSFAAFTDLVTEKEPSITFRVSPGSGIGNSATIAEGTFDIGWVYPPMCQLAYNGEAPYGQKYEDIRIIATGLSPQVIEVVARASVDVSNIDEIFSSKKGIHWLTPNKGSTTPALFFDIMLQYYGVTEADLKSWGGSATYTPYSDWAQLVQDKHVDIMFNQGSMPFSTTQEIAANTKLKLISLPQDLREYMVSKYALEDYTIKGGTYAWEANDIQTLQMCSGLGCNKNIDDQTVYRILEIIEANMDEFKSISGSFKNFSLETAWQNHGDVPLHPGAEKFYKDHGYMN